jgi:hypothetical protein
MEHLHNFLRWAVLITLIASLYRAYIGWKKGQTNAKLDNLLSILTVSFADVQLLLGFYMYLKPAPNSWLSAYLNMPMADAMHSNASRFWKVEHITGMLIAIVLLHLGRVFYKKKNWEEAKRYQRWFVFFFVAFVIIMATIPWPFREAGIARGWLPA